ncbi:unnamed protein product [Blepharisma stoltei]|uniref:Cyclic nucleotide-binding domain-containing protein n=1 Tax=Blepharisma stoltei TaxID=1481888 RepID=A0AAU9J9T9_9CILI|nr:unnamed protein product [Blepharisma stoltei]
MIESFVRRNSVSHVENENLLKFKKRNSYIDLLKGIEGEDSLSQAGRNNLFILIRMVLELKPSERTPEMIEKVYQWTKNLKFFQKLTEANSVETHIACCNYLQYEFHEAGSLVIKQGDMGTKFYIILDGKVSVIREDEGEDTFEMAELGTGEAFGERALMLGVPRACSIKCITNCSLGVLEISDYKKVLDSFMEEKYNLLIAMLREFPIFKNSSRHYLQRLTYQFKPRKYQKKQCVYKEGDPTSEVFIIQKGEFNLSKKLKISLQSSKAFPKTSNLKNKKISKNAQIVSLSKGCMFGEEEILSGLDNRSTSCFCVSDEGHVLVISKESFKKNILKSEDAVDFLRKRTENKLASRQTTIDQNLYLQKLHSGIIPIRVNETPPPISPLKQLPPMPINASKPQSSKYPVTSRDFSNISPIRDLSVAESRCKSPDEKGSLSLRKSSQPVVPPLFNSFNTPITPSVISDSKNPSPSRKLQKSESMPIFSNSSRKSTIRPIEDYINSSRKKPEKLYKVKEIVNIHTHMMKIKNLKKEASKHFIRTCRGKTLTSSALLEIDKDCESPIRIEKSKLSRKSSML